ncbi:ankyrin repeat domain-containing protein 26-like [Moschus berezovskii]|uniref:ankyrin repeat domain-containing protein 26-like n=1 Tax=Moschus berezovskii TaxID=68408 RepID=UPI002444CC27|nr:ankyrin repeat domain-containing protein 26-like [Moschus berezovskii]
MNQQMSSDCFFSKALTSFPKMFLDGLQKDMLLLVVLLEAKCGILRPESTTLSGDNNSDSNIEDVVETFLKPSPWFEGICHPAFPLPEPVPKLLKSVAGLGHTKRSVSEALPQEYVDHLPGTAGQRGQKTLNGQVEDVSYIPSCMSGLRNFEMARLEEPRHVGIPVAHMDMGQTMVEIMKIRAPPPTGPMLALLHSVPLTLRQATSNPRLRQRLLENKAEKRKNTVTHNHNG